MVSTASDLTSRQAIVTHNAVLFTADGPNGPLGQIATWPVEVLMLSEGGKIDDDRARILVHNVKEWNVQAATSNNVNAPHQDAPVS